MRKCLCFLALLLVPAASLFAAAPASLELVSLDGKAAFVIVVADDAIPAEKTAAKELKKYLDKITGASFTIKSETGSSASEPQIVVGAGQRAKEFLGSGFDWKQVGLDGIVLQSGNGWLVLAGDRPRGSLYAVYELLEGLGVRFWYPGATDVPTNPNLTLPEQNTVYTPPFSYRENFNSVTCAGIGGKPDEEYTTQLRENGHFNHQKDEWGGHYTIIGWCHTLPELLPIRTYFKQHPEWFSNPADGYKPFAAGADLPAFPHGYDGQIDFTAPGVAEEVAKNALERIRKDPKAGYISISQADGSNNFCTGEGEMAVVGQEGSHSGALIAFVNKVAEIIHKDYPNFRVETLAYQQSIEPPKTVRPGDNVLIRFAPLGADFGHPFESEGNKGVRDHMEKWSAVAPQLFLWNYVTNFSASLLPHPNWSGLAADLRYAAGHHVTGVFEQGNNYTNGVGDFAELRGWLLGKLLWNPNQDQSALTDQFLTGFYGPAAGPLMRQYLDLYENAYLASKKGLSTYNDDYSFMDIERMNQATKLFDQAAEAVKGDKALADRVARARVTLDLLWIYDYKRLKAEAKDGEFLGPADREKGSQEISATLKGYGVGQWGEGGSIDAALQRSLTR